MSKTRPKICEECKCKVERGREAYFKCKILCQICYNKKRKRNGRPEGLIDKFYRKWAKINE